jgi:hypothetical protein
MHGEQSARVNWKIPREWVDNFTTINELVQS